MHFLRGYLLASRGAAAPQVPTIILQDMRIFSETPRPSWRQGFNRSHHWSRRRLAPQSPPVEQAGLLLQLASAPAALASLIGRTFASRTLVVFYLARLLSLLWAALLLWGGLLLAPAGSPRRTISLLTITLALLPTFSLCLGIALPVAAATVGLAGGFRLIQRVNGRRQTRPATPPNSPAPQKPKQAH